LPDLIVVFQAGCHILSRHSPCHPEVATRLAMSWSAAAWRPAHNKEWDNQRWRWDTSWGSSWHTSVSPDTPVPVVGLPGTTRILARQDTDGGKTYDSFSTLGGTSRDALPLRERAKLIVFMMPLVRKLRVATLTSNELDAVIYLATGQQPDMRAELSFMRYNAVSASYTCSTFWCCPAMPS